jgi:protein arginine kinase
MPNWIKYEGDAGDIVLSSRIRLARNILDVPFPHKLNKDQSKMIINQIEEGFHNLPLHDNEYNTIHLWENNEMENRLFLERHLISNKLLHNYEKAAFIVDKDETVCIMVNEEDHVRIQCINAGLALKETFEKAYELDDLLENNLSYAFDEELGYLTTCPTNSGTGLRASVMVHLPGLTMEKEMNKILNAVSKVGMTIRGLYGEGSKNEGNLYQISNQVTLGLEEEEILNNLQVVVNQIINQEKLARAKILKKYKYELHDKINRSLGILKSAVLLNSKECLNLLSNVRMGVELGIIKDISKKDLNELLIEISPAYIQMECESKLSQKERDLKRAEITKSKLGGNLV